MESAFFDWNKPSSETSVSEARTSHWGVADVARTSKGGGDEGERNVRALGPVEGERNVRALGPVEGERNVRPPPPVQGVRAVHVGSGVSDIARSASPSPIPRIGSVPSKIKVVDETLRDGLQNPSGKNPPVVVKSALLPAMAQVGVDVVSVGLPAAGGRYEADTIALCQTICDLRLPLIATAAARTVVADVEGIARAADRTGMSIEVYSFIGSSPIRKYVEGWSNEFLVNAVTSAAQAAARNNLPFCLVTEDTTRSHPDLLKLLFRAAIDAGAARLCLCDTTGHVTPYGVEELVGFARSFLAEIGAPHVQLDWHGHNDRGLGLPIALWAAAAGVDRVHGTGLGVGERVGNTPLELLVDNLGLLGARARPTRAALVDYCDRAAAALDWEIPFDHPIAGARARGVARQAAARSML